MIWTCGNNKKKKKEKRSARSFFPSNTVFSVIVEVLLSSTSRKVMSSVSHVDVVEKLVVSFPGEDLLELQMHSAEDLVGGKCDMCNKSFVDGEVYDLCDRPRPPH